MDIKELIERGVNCALKPKSIMSNSGKNEVNTTGLNDLDSSEITTDFSELIYEYLGFSATAAIRLYRETREQIKDIIRFLSTVQATDNIISNLSLGDANVKWNDVEVYANNLFTEIFKDEKISEDTPNTNDDDFKAYIVELVKSIVSSTTSVDTFENTYDIVFEDGLPEDVTPISLTKIIKACITQEDFTGKNKADKPTIDYIVNRLITDFGLCLVDGQPAIFDRKANIWRFGIQWVFSCTRQYIFRHITKHMMGELEAVLFLPETLEVRPLLPSKYIAFKNCIVDFTQKNEDGQFKAYQHGPSWIFKDVINYDYNPNASDAFIKEIVRDAIARKDI